MRLPILVLFTAVSAAISVVSAQSQLGTGAISGTVQDSTGGGFNTTAYNATVTTNTTLLSTPIQLTPATGFPGPISDATPPDGTNGRRLQLSVRFRF